MVAKAGLSDALTSWSSEHKSGLYWSAMPLRLSHDLIIENDASRLALALVFKSIFSSYGDFNVRLHGI
jgi:hypothetical protein